MRISFKRSQNFNLENIQQTNQIHSIEHCRNINHEVDNKIHLELEYNYILEYDTNVKFYYETPMEIFFKNMEKDTSLIPSYIVEYYNRKTDIILINERERSVSNFQNNKLLHIVNSFCKKNNFCLKALTEADIYTDQLFNAKFLLYFRNPLIRINNYDIEILLDIVKREKKITVSNTIAKASKVKDRQAELLYVLWYCISNSLLEFNKNERLKMDTFIEI